MRGFNAASIFILTGVMTLNAGQIIIGGSDGLTSFTSGSTVLGYVVNATASSCAGMTASYNPGVTKCQTTNSQGVFASAVNTAWIPKTYANALYGNAGGLSTASPATGSLVTDPSSGVTFQLGQTGSLGNYNSDVSGISVAGLVNLSIPIGIFGVDQVSTLLQDYWAANNAPGLPGGPGAGFSTSVTFEFNATSSDGSTGANILDTIYLQTGVDIRSGVKCTSGSATANNGFACGSTAPGAPQTGIVASTTNGDATIKTSTAYTSTFSSIPNGYYMGSTAGSLFLDDQTFSFGGKYNSDFLVGLTISNMMTPFASRVYVGGVTVDQVAAVSTPEPSAVMLLMAGLGSIGLAKFRRRK